MDPAPDRLFAQFLGAEMGKKPLLNLAGITLYFQSEMGPGVSSLPLASTGVDEISSLVLEFGG
jgi:hypothetical protein